MAEWLLVRQTFKVNCILTLAVNPAVPNQVQYVPPPAAKLHDCPGALQKQSTLEVPCSTDTLDEHGHGFANRSNTCVQDMRLIGCRAHTQDYFATDAAWG